MMKAARVRMVGVVGVVVLGNNEGEVRAGLVNM